MWIEARRKRRQPQQPRRTRLVAALTLGVCLGSVAGISALFLADKLLPQAWLRASYFVVFFAAIGWACVRRPARAGHELLWLCAVLTALVPAAAWIGTGAPPWVGLAHGDATRLVVGRGRAGPGLGLLAHGPRHPAPRPRGRPEQHLGVAHARGLTP